MTSLLDAAHSAARHLCTDLHVSELHKSYVIPLHESRTVNVDDIFTTELPRDATIYILHIITRVQVETRRVTLPKCWYSPAMACAESHPQALWRRRRVRVQEVTAHVEYWMYTM
ncbi:hypothetical protein Hypma_004556 [Hypsizygus marmoreus]|uniref:Uncharacterized protein n=1 Tax=Hypsizygus marmoreus TaxID=39966 RepID=A0A369J064_HYPMA|nr:hypothetical protein Hypma_004556 [Hypsizygus marmoreus]